MKILAVTALAALAVAGAAVAQPAATAPAHRACFWKRNVENFAAHDDKAIYVRVGVNQVFELKMFGNCFNLSWLHRIGLMTHGSSNICEGPNPDLYVIARQIGVGPQRCPVTYVRKLTPAEVAALPKDARP